MSVDHEFSPRSNHRYPRSCQRCGKTPEEHPVSPHMERNPAFEHGLIALAGQAAGLDHRGLVLFAEQRAHPGPVRNATERNMRVEALEEIADTYNYICWRAQKHRGDPDVYQECALALSDLLAVWVRVVAWRDELAA